MSSFHLSRVVPTLVSIIAAVFLAVGAHAQCPQPVNFTATNTGCFVRLRWQNTPGAPQPVFWSVYRGLQPNASDAVLIDSRGAGTFEYFDARPQRGVTYYYYIRGSVLNGPCAIANLNSSIVPGMLLPVPMTSLALRSQDCSGITLAWDAFPDAQSFTIVRKLATDIVESVIATAPAGSTSYTDTTAVPGSTYFYGVLVNTPCVPGPTTAGIQATMYRAVQTGAPPVSAIRNIGESVTFNFNFNGAIPAVSYFVAITRDGQGIDQSPRISYGVNQSSITITNIQPGDEGEYVCTVGNDCGVATQRAVLAVRQRPCRADFNNSGGPPTVQDIFDFLNAWFTGCP